MDRLYLLDLGSYDPGAPCNTVRSPVTDAMLDSLPHDKREGLLRCRHALDIKIVACSEVLLRCLVSEELGVGFGALDIRTGPMGKPFVAGAPRLHFSISHTRSAVAAVLSDAPAGIDVERIRETDLNIASTVCSEKELSLLSGPPEDRWRMFLEIWTKKEACLKRCGTGLAGDPRACDVTVRVPGQELTTFCCGDYVVSVCTESPVDAGGLRRLSGTDVTDMWRHRAK